MDASSLPRTEPTPGPASESAALTRRLRALLKTAPFHRLRAGQGRFQCLRPHDDPTALCVQALDTLINALGVSSGVSHEELTAALIPHLAAADRRAGLGADPERHREAAALCIGVLLNDLSRRQAYEEQYHDFESGADRVLRFRLASEQETPDGRIVIRAEPDGVNLLLRALDIELEDAQAATEAALRAQLQRGRFDLALQSAHEARIRSVQYHDKIHALLRKTQRDVGNVDWRREAPRLLKEAIAHLQSRLVTEREIRSEVQACLARLADEDTGPDGEDPTTTVEALLQMNTLIDACCQRHLQLHQPLLAAFEVFRDEQARQRFAPLPLTPLCAPEHELLRPILLAPGPAALAISDAFAVAATPATAPALLDLGRLWDTLLRPRRHGARAPGPEQTPETLQALRQEPPLFDEDIRQAVDDRLRALPGPMKLSQLLPEFPDERAARLLTLRCLHHFAADVQALPLCVTLTGAPLRTATFCGDDLEVETLETVEISSPPHKGEPAQLTLRGTPWT